MNARLIDVGRMGYHECWELQREIAGGVIEGDDESLIFVEHPPVLTLGASFHAENLLLTEAEYRALGIELASTDRGGDVTYHGPGQLVIYPIFDIQRHGKDLHKWMRDLEETMLVTLGELGIEGRRFPPHTGAWVGDKKIAAIGVKIRRWVNIHGIALNCDNDLDPFGKIVPCGIEGYGVTSLSVESGRPVTVADAKPLVLRAFESVFGLTLRNQAPSQ